MRTLAVLAALLLLAALWLDVTVRDDSTATTPAHERTGARRASRQPSLATPDDADPHHVTEPKRYVLPADLGAQPETALVEPGRPVPPDPFSVPAIVDPDRGR